VDHVKAHSRGGRTDSKNAAVLCKPCNASKGNRGVRQRRVR
jgi:5-methylcytosine-specific restriction endonuclease McrA